LRSSLCGLVMVAAANAQPRPFVHPDGTTHWYEAVLVAEGIDWHGALGRAAIAGGYLVTITSTSEQSFVSSLVSGPEYWSNGSVPNSWWGPWTDGRQHSRAVEPDGGWYWGQLEPLVHTEWAPGWPQNDLGANRICLGGATGVMKWADAPAIAKLKSYVIEYSGPLVPRTLGLQQQDDGAFKGYTLMTPWLSTWTFLLDMRGREVHRWTSQ
jgi:hypothetical protein